MIEMIVGDAAAIPLADDTVDLIVTSPPYNVGKNYGPSAPDDLDHAIYRSHAIGWAYEMHRILKPGGRLFINTACATSTNGEDGQTLGYRHNLLAEWMTTLDRVGLLFRDVIVWDKDIGNANTSWGSYLSPNRPNLRGRWEPILSYFKTTWDRGRPERNDIHPDDWTTITRNVWRFTPNGADPWHPATYPIELPTRAILISTWPGDLVVDPFAGSGTTLRAAHRLGRNAIGIDNSEIYVRGFHDRGLQPALEMTT